MLHVVCMGKNTGFIQGVSHKLAVAINILFDCIMGIYFVRRGGWIKR